MKLEEQVVSLELARQLKELGFEQGKSLFIIRRDGGHIILNKTNEWDGNREHYYSAYTVAELYNIHIEKFGKCYIRPNIQPEYLADYLAEKIINNLKPEVI